MTQRKTDLPRWTDRRYRWCDAVPHFSKNEPVCERSFSFSSSLVSVRPSTFSPLSLLQHSLSCSLIHIFKCVLLRFHVFIQKIKCYGIISLKLLFLCILFCVVRNWSRKLFCKCHFKSTEKYCHYLRKKKLFENAHSGIKCLWNITWVCKICTPVIL